MALRDRDLVPQKKERTRWGFAVPLILALLSGWGIRTGLRTFLYEPVVISESSMAPALEQGDVRYASRRFAPSSLKITDLVWLEHPLNTEYRMIRRIVAREGDTVEVRQGAVLVNGTVIVPAPLAPPRPKVSDDADGGQKKKSKKSEHQDRSAEEQASFFDRPPEKLPADSFFVLADGPGLDSRHFGPVPAGKILGVIR